MGDRRESTLGIVESSDPRQSWLVRTVQNAFRGVVKVDRLKKFFAADDVSDKIEAFMDKDAPFIAFLEGGGGLTVTIKPPEKFDGKLLYFLKTTSGQVSFENFEAEILIGNMNMPALNHLCSVLQEIYMPLISNPRNQDGWSELVTKDVMDNMHIFIAGLQITVGQTEGKTCLPLPPDSESSVGANQKDRVHILEGCLITWTKQIKNVLKQDPETLLKQGQHPGPHHELLFWRDKAHNLNSIFEQLQSERVRQVLKFLDNSKSTYNVPFAKLCKEVFQARAEANDNCKFLKPFEEWFAQLKNEAVFECLEETFAPIMHLLLLVWKNSRFYNTPPRLVVVVQEICNQIISQGCKFVDGATVFQLIEAEETAKAVAMLKVMLRVCGRFKSTYFNYKAKANSECPTNPWRIQNNALFVRMDAFLERCHDILDLTQTIVQFMKLSKIEIGGTKGKTLTTSVAQIFVDFVGAVDSFKAVDYDIMDVDAKSFDDDFYEFRCRIKELERRLASVLTQGFDDCATITGKFKLLDSFEGLLERPVIHDELEKKHLTLIAAYGADLHAMQQLFVENREAPPIASNLPPIAGALNWCRGLLERIKQPMEKLRQLNRAVLDREEAKEVVKTYTSLVASLGEFEHLKIEQWGEEIEEASQAKLRLPLLRRDEDSDLLRVNFDPKLVELLREVKYFLLLGLSVPASALTVYKKAELYRRQTGNLDLIVNMYNNVQTTLLPVERPLLKAHLDKIDKSLKQGLKSINWKSHGIDFFISDSMAGVKDCAGLLSMMKDSLSTVEGLLEDWAAFPLFERRHKPVTVAELQEVLKTLRQARYAAISDGGKQVHKLLKDINKKLRVSQGLPDWRAYVDFINNIVVAGLADVVTVSLDFLNQQFDPEVIVKEDKMPMLEIELELYDKEVMFVPNVGEGKKGKEGIRDIVDGWINSFYHVGTLFKRLDGNEGNYMKELQEHPAIQMYLATINENLMLNESKCDDLRSNYVHYDYLWTTDLNKKFSDFVATVWEDIINEDGDNTGRRRLSLGLFDERIVHFREIQGEISELRHSADIDFLRVNSQPIKQALSTWVTKWVFAYTSFLQDHVTDKLTALGEFMERVNTGLERPIAPGDKEGLTAVMTHIRDVRKAMEETLEVFSPLRDTVLLLKTHGIDMSSVRIFGENCVDYLESAPVRWDNTINTTFKTKEQIQPLQNAQADTIKKEIATFGGRVRRFRKEFKDKAPFAFTGAVSEAYAIVDEYERMLVEVEQEAGFFREQEELFELAESKYEALRDSRDEIKRLKMLWDMSSLIDFIFDTWRQQLWAEILTDDILDETTRIQTQVKQMPRELKGYDVYKRLQDRINNMATVIPLIHELHSPALQDRHWKTLMTVTHKHFERGPNFCLDDVLQLELHMHVDDVSELVEVANKELKIEKKLGVVEKIWTTMMLEFRQYKDTEVKILQAPEELMEALEEHQLQLQTMIGMGRFVEYFRERVLHWQRTLGNVETTLKLWLSVQKQWTSLESIFMASADIRAQLPEDTKRFEGIDQEFKELMREAQYVPSAVESCTREGREEVLRAMMGALEKCQKALNEYLDTKKNIFPRFYFLSNTALLDILSNGNNPPKIMPHVGDCFDAINNLDFIPVEPPPARKDDDDDDEGGGGGETKTAIPKVVQAMIAKDGERVDFMAEHEIQGAVERWLGELVGVMQDTLRAVLDKSLDSAANWEVDHPRDKWVFEFPAQICLLAAQIFWTEETESSLDELEGGDEEAVKKYSDVVIKRLNALITLVQGSLTKQDRNKIISLITMDVHNRDVVADLISTKAGGSGAFLWQSQLKFFYKEDTRDVRINITDWKSLYSYEYLGNTGRLVITPLTDRCYITLTMALRLMLGGAPAGPAGTGKTETTKDLARALGLPCYVFNCSDQMNFESLGDTFRGLSQTGAWGCFDEFNRIPIEVLSVVATQVKSVLDAIRLYSNPLNREEQYQSIPAGQPPAVVGYFDFMNTRVYLVPTTGFFITMNPGYAGRTELPENLKVHFRSCAMIRPDLKPICENMLMAEGFIRAKPLSIKFVTLYALASELLSPQAHYDWGLRAVKSVLRVAGNLKRAEPEVEEDAILMRALRDFNTPKMPSQDIPIFLRLIGDLFPGMDLPTKVDESLKESAIAVSKANGLQPDDIFVGKVIQFQELLDVRHSVMLLGPAGAGKTSIWKTLMGCHNKGLAKPICVGETVNPKSVTSDELYGFLTLSKDWKDGVLSIVMRNMSKNWPPFFEAQTMKWVILDGDIDAVWIESMNTVMDDNKVLTLVSNERISLTDAMRMVFEIHSLKNATPATVSRAGILYINETDIGWRPVMESWVHRRVDEVERATLPSLFEKYVDPVLLMMRQRKMTPVIPVTTISCVMTICNLLEGLLAPLKSKNKQTVENLFVFACIWAFGGALGEEKTANFRQMFSKVWREDFKDVALPERGSIFDYFFSFDTSEEGTVTHWSERVETYTPVGDTPFHAIVVSTVDTTRLSFLLDLLVQRRKAVCLVGSAGTGKTTLVKDFFRNQGDDSIISCIINMNYYTDSFALQKQLEQPIDKRSGKIFGPPSTKRLIYFIDDLNMPFVETYGTQTPIALLRQHMDYGAWFDRGDLGLKKDIQDIQFIAAMNPKCGSFTINPRLQRHYATFAALMPGVEDLRTIYGAILESHIGAFDSNVQKVAPMMVNAAIELHRQVTEKFLPSAVKFTYNFNMREMANVFQGVCLSKPDYYMQPIKMIRLWMHESTHVFSDRLVSPVENKRFEEMLTEVCKKYFEDFEQDKLQEHPIVFTSFASNVLTDDERLPYLPVKSLADLKVTLDRKLSEYNEANPIMDLVLFGAAMDHVCRITRIIENPRGNALLVGLGGSGKQSLSRLASFICGYKVSMLAVSSTFGIPDLKEFLKTMYNRSAVKPAQPLVFMLTDAQILDERFLVYINDLLSSGYIPDLFAKDEYDSVFSALRNEAKAAGIPDSRDNMMEFFIERVRQNLHVILCFSPAGDTFRNRSRKFPGLVNCTSIDYFHAWPRDALVSVAGRFLFDVEEMATETKENIAHHMSEVHLSVTDYSLKYRAQQRRHNYVTPKSFLELITFYKSLLGVKRTESNDAITRLDTGLTTLQKTAADVAQLKEALSVKMVQVEEKKAATDALLEKMGKERGEAETQQAQAAEEQKKANAASAEAAAIEAEAEGELAVARPAMEQAADAVNCLSKASLTELKNFNKPPAGVDKVTAAVLIMLKGEKKNLSWENAKKMMAKVDAFKSQLENYRGEDIDEETVERVAPILEDPDFTVQNMKKKSDAAANLCSWVINIVNFNRIYKKVRPLMDRLAVAQATKAEAVGNLAAVNAVVAEVEARLAALQAEFLAATTEKARVEAEAEACNNRLSLANRLVNGLASENDRWGKEVASLRERSTMVAGDVLISSAFVSYIGAFNASMRNSLWREVWLPDIISREILITDGIDPLEILTNDSKSAEWQNQGLGADRISIENGAIITQCARWPLIIDPQLQGIKWLRNKEEQAAADGPDDKELVVVQLTQKNWMKHITMAIQAGNACIIENLGEEIEPVLEPILARAVYRKGKNLFVSLGGEEVEYDDRFKLYLQTKLQNPHYKPEIAAQCTLINFIVTEQGLSDQLLAKVVNREEPDLEAQSRDLLQKFNQYKIQLLDLENQLLQRLADAPEDILSDVPLIEGLEATKQTSTEIAEAVVRGKETKAIIDKARSAYRSVAVEASMLYFLLIQLNNMDHMYQYSLDSFTIFFFKSMDLALAGDAKQESKGDGDDMDDLPPPGPGPEAGGGDGGADDIVAKRVQYLRESLRMTIFRWVSRGLFQRHVLIFLSSMVFELCRRAIVGEDSGFSVAHMNFLLKGAGGSVNDDDNPVDWLSDIAWNAVGALGEQEGFHQFPSDIVESAPRFKEWYNLLAPEREKLPLDWRELDKQPFLKLLAVRSLRPDRMQFALSNFVGDVMPKGPEFVEMDQKLNSYQVLESAFEDSTNRTPIYFILSPGVDVVADVDRLALKLGMEVGVNYHNISLGQGQDIIAMDRLEAGHQEGHWVILNNVHLMPRWLRELEKRLDEYAIVGSHEKFRVFLSSDPSKTIPIGILDRCIKLTNEPPAGVKANLKRAFCSFSQEEIDEMDSKTRGILFGLCHFHAVMLERRTFGPKGYNMHYPFAIGDLTGSAVVLKNYMENATAKIPWDDLRYLFGDIMYGGHIVNDWDRLMCQKYLEYFLRDELLDEMEMYPYMDDDSKSTFKAPALTNYENCLKHIDKEMKGDTPLAFGLHPNAEIDFRTSASNNMFSIMLELSSGAGGDDGGGQSMQHVAEASLQDILDTYRDLRFDLVEIIASCDDDPGPFQNVFIQECERMDALVEEMVRSLLELELGFKGDLTMSDAMETLCKELYMEKVPMLWAKRAFPSQRPLGGWLHNVAERINQLQDWIANPIETPRVTWISGLFNPQSFLTAIMQVTAQKGGLELDKLVVITDILKRKMEEVDQPSRDGALVHGLFMEGARWDMGGGVIETSKPKEMVCAMPVINCKAILSDKAVTSQIYQCPVYKTQQRGPTYVFTATLRSKAPPAKWTLAGVVLVQDIV